MAAQGIRAVSCTVRSARIWDRQAPLLERVRLALPGLREEAREYVRAWRTLEDEDLLIVPGTGLLTDAWALSRWGPYGLLRWSLVARLRGCRVILLSVGAGLVPADSVAFSCAPRSRSRTTGPTGTFRAEWLWKASAFPRAMIRSTRISFSACRPLRARRRRIAWEDDLWSASD